MKKEILETLTEVIEKSYELSHKHKLEECDIYGKAAPETELCVELFYYLLQGCCSIK